MLKPPVWFKVLTAAFVALLVVAVAGRADTNPTTSTEPEPTPPPPPTTVTVANPVESAQVRGLQRKLTATRKARVRDRYHYRRALQVVIHGDVAGEHPLERAFKCIHSGEGRWDDPNPPYWGGIQMDKNFMKANMPWAYSYFGTADRWPISVQITAGIHAVIAGRGFHPWPNTARVCGLLR